MRYKRPSSSFPYGRPREWGRIKVGGDPQEVHMEEEKFTQVPTIKKAVTYIVDENGIEKELDLIAAITKDDFCDDLKSP
jgi:hypothetical protein